VSIVSIANWPMAVILHVILLSADTKTTWLFRKMFCTPFQHYYLVFFSFVTLLHDLTPR
jgi:hypothetical protein